MQRYHFMLVFGSVPGLSVILIEGFRGFIQFLRANAGIELSNRSRALPSKSLLVHPS
jgi:hypothetical protein